MTRPWEGDLRAGWTRQPFWTEFRRGKTLGNGTEELLSVYREYGVIPKASRDDNFNKPSEDLSTYQLVATGDLVINKMKAWQGSLGVSAHDGIVSPAYFVYKAVGALDRRFAHYLLRSNGYAQHMGAISSGIRPNQWDLDPIQLSSTLLLVPPAEEQRAIADFLDRETAQIDAFIAKNEELIALLAERRNAVTATAVTRGVDPGIELQDSHVPWLGNVPAGWRAVRLKFVVDSLPGYAFASADFTDGTGAAPLLRGVNVGVGRIAWDDVVSIVDAASDVTRRYALIAGDLVVGMDRPVIKGGLRVAEITEADEGALLVQRVLRLRGRGVRNAFLQYALEWGGFAMYIEPDFTGVSVPHMSEQQVRNFTIALPDLATQDRVIAHIRGQHASIDSALEAARRSVDLARERRAALISAAVTGKIDVGVSA